MLKAGHFEVDGYRGSRLICTSWFVLMLCVFMIMPPVYPAPKPGSTSGTKTIPVFKPSMPDAIGDKWAVVIGIGRFADPQVPALKYADKDARDFYDYLIDPKAGNFQKDHVKLLLNDQATKVNIMDMLGDSFLPHAANPDDLVVIYFSTHGSPAGADIRGVNYAVAYDSQLRRLFATGLEMRQLFRIVKERVHTNRLLLVLDTCYSGAGAESHKGLMRTNVDSQGLAQGIGSLIISSSSPEQKSWESDELRNGYFTKYLIDALKEKPQNATIDQAFNNMKQKVQASVLKDKGEIQTPVMSGSFSGPKLVLGSTPVHVHQAPITVPIGGDVVESGKGTAMDLSAYGERMRSALSLLEKDRLWDASHELEAAIQVNPKSVEAQLLACDLYDSQSRYNEAFEAAKKAVVNDPESSQGREKLARSYMRMDQSFEAMRQAQKSVTLDPANSMAYYWMGYINENYFKRSDLAEQEYRKALELNSLNGRAYLGLARLLKKQGGKSDVIEGFVRKALESDADYADAHLELGRLFLAAGRFKEAESEIRKGVSADPNNPVLHAELGNVLALDRSRAAGAEAEYQKALELGPNVGLCHLAFARFLMDEKSRPEEAERQLNLAIKLDPDLDDARVTLARLLLAKKTNYDEAFRQCKKALEINPKNASAHLYMAKVKIELYKDFPAAEDELKQAVALAPQMSEAYDVLGLLYEKWAGRYAEAKKSLEKAVQTDPKNARAHYHLAMLLLKKPAESTPQVIYDHLLKAVDNAPEESSYYVRIGFMQQQYFKKYKEAEASYRKALECNSADAEAHMRLGLLLIERFRLRKPGEAELKTALELNPEDPETKAACERFIH